MQNMSSEFFGVQAAQVSAVRWLSYEVRVIFNFKALYGIIYDLH